MARSIAVLPFVDMSADGGGAYLGDGLADELIAALGRVDELHVAARTSSFALRDARLGARALGDSLGVATLVEGSVRRDGGRLRVTVQLVDAASGYRVWSGEYDREPKDLLAVQDEIASAIAGALRVTLTGRPDAGTAGPARAEAHDFYLRGSYFRNRLAGAGIAKAVAYFDRAIAADSTYALAYAGKASALGPRFFYHHPAPAAGLAEMRGAAQRALALDDQLGEAHVAVGMIRFFWDWDWEASRREFVRATELNPRDAHAWHHLGNWLRAMRRVDEAIAARSRALELDPLNARTLLTLADDHLSAGHHERAAELYRRAMDIDPDNPILLGLGPALPAGLCQVYEVQGRLDAAVDEYVRIAERRGAGAAEQRALRAAFASGGMRAFWERWLRFEERAAAGGHPRALRLARIRARMGDADGAAAAIEQAYAERDPGLVYLGSDRWLDTARDHPRVRAVLARMGLRG